MGIPVLILGESGSGKSTSLRNFDENELIVFNVANKLLPFRKKLEIVKKRKSTTPRKYLLFDKYLTSLTTQNKKK